MTTTPDGPELTMCTSCDTTACPGECAGDCDGHCGPVEIKEPVRLDLPVASRRNAMGAFETIGDKLADTEALSPADAMKLLDKVLSASIEVVRIKISGPGDPLATPVTVIDTVTAVREKLPEVEISVVTNGLNVAEHAAALREAGVTHATLMIDAITPETAEKLFVWIRPGKRTLNLDAAAAVLVEEQLAAARALVENSIRLTIRSTLYPEINADELPDVAEQMAKIGAVSLNLIRTENTTEELFESMSKTLAEIIPMTKGGCDCSEHMVDLSSLPGGAELLGSGSPQAAISVPTGDRPFVAVASESGMEVDCHLGHAPSFLIYGKATGTSEEGLVKLLETRPAPPPGGGAERWRWLAHTLKDCSVVLASGAGERPREVLAANDIRVMITEGEIDSVVDTIFGGGKKGKGRK